MGNTLTITGTNLIGIVAVNFYFNGLPFQIQPPPFVYSTTATSYTLSVSFAGQSGDFQVEVVNAANQVSNRLSFTVQPVGRRPSPRLIQRTVQEAWSRRKDYNRSALGARISSCPLRRKSSITAQSLSSDPGRAIVGVIPSAVLLLFDFQGNSGTYGIEIFGPGGQYSDVFNFNVAAP